jgi:hypothetical protein
MTPARPPAPSTLALDAFLGGILISENLWLPKAATMAEFMK